MMGENIENVAQVKVEFPDSSIVLKEVTTPFKVEPIIGVPSDTVGSPGQSHSGARGSIKKVKAKWADDAEMDEELTDVKEEPSTDGSLDMDTGHTNLWTGATDKTQIPVKEESPEVKGGEMYLTLTKSTLDASQNIYRDEKIYSWHPNLWTGRTDSNFISQIHVKENSPEVTEYNMEGLTKSTLDASQNIYRGEKIFPCDFCDYKCRRSRNLKTHMMIHTGETPFVCSVCDYKCRKPDHLKTHMLVHTDEKPYSCEFCDYKCKHAGSLRKHMRSHTGEKPYACDICDYVCSEVGNLKRHMMSHTGQKPYTCEFCDYKCSRICYLKDHIRTHTGERPYPCKVCDHRFKLAGELRNHLKTHTGEPPHACDFCDFKSYRNSELTRHIKTHTGEKPYACSVCDCKFIRTIDLNRHMRT